MNVITAELKFYITHATSLKDKRQVAQSIIQKSRHKFNASIAEVDTQDVWQTLTIGIAVVSTNAKHAKTMIDEIIDFMESITDAELTDIFID